MKQLYVHGDKAYLIDLDSFHKKMFEPMPMTVPPPEPEPFSLRMLDHFAPVFRSPMAFVMSSFYDEPSPWQFVYLFPLGKRAYRRK